MKKPEPKRILLLMRNNSYRGRAFYEAAQRLGIEVIAGVDVHPDLADYWKLPLSIQFHEPDKAVSTIVELAQHRPLLAVMAVDDSAALIAARANTVLGLRHDSAESALAARNKFQMRRLFAAADLASPQFRLYEAIDDPMPIASALAYPCVVKPTLLSGSRGVIRADNPAEFVAAFGRLSRMLLAMQRTPGSTQVLVEDFIPGVEVALEGVIDQGQLHVLALFDKPDPLDGPFFEETIYVTPSRLPQEVQAQITECARRAAAALGLRYGPVHAELRVNEAGPFMLEIAGRSIGGLCSQTLRFGLGDISLEELILRQAAGMELTRLLKRKGEASGVMMIPIPSAGLLKKVEGVESAEEVSGVEAVQITAKLNQPLVPLPEGDSYLGFIFARGDSPENVEVALRQAHQQLHFTIEEILPLALIGT